MNMNVAALYVAYNPDAEYLLRSIEVVRRYLSCVIVIDNSEDNKRFCKHVEQGLEPLIILNQNQNIGIASALNKGCRKAIELGFDWVITFDQDSIPSDDMMGVYDEFLRKHTGEKIGAIGPKFRMNDADYVAPDQDIREVNTLITSGSLLSMSAFIQVGGFEDELFIDAVDTEYSWKLRKNGYRLYQIGSAVLNHNIGNASYHIRLFGKRLMTVTNHTALRRYYITRNSLKISEDYRSVFPEEAKQYRKKWMKQLIMVVCFEKDKLSKIRAIFRGYKDFKVGFSGKYPY